MYAQTFVTLILLPNVDLAMKNQYDTNTEAVTVAIGNNLFLPWSISVVSAAHITETVLGLLDNNDNYLVRKDDIHHDLYWGQRMCWYWGMLQESTVSWWEMKGGSWGGHT